MNIFKKMKRTLFGYTIFEEIRDISCLKKISDNEKFSMLIRTVGEYFEEKHSNFTYQCVAENYFELVIDGKEPNNEEFLKIMKMQGEEITDLVFLVLISVVLDLKIDFSKLSSKEQEIFLGVHTISEMVKPNSEVGKLVKNLGEDFLKIEQKVVENAKDYYKECCKSTTTQEQQNL